MEDPISCKRQLLLKGWADDIDQTFVCTHFQLFARSLCICISRTNDCVELRSVGSEVGPATCAPVR